MKNLILIFLLTITTQFNFAQTANFDFAKAQSKKIIQEVIQDSQVPGMVVLVSIKGETVWAEGFGFADLEQEVKADPVKTKFRIGSISKPYTALALAQLYEAGKIDLDAPIQEYVSSFPKKEYPITLRQLTGHLAGIRHYKGNEFLSSKYYPTVGEGLVIFKDDPLLHKPNSKYAYSSYGWNLISAAIENAAGQDFLEYMDNKVFAKIGMSNTAADHVAVIIPNRTRFYVVQNDEVYNAPFVDNSYKWAGGGFISTAEDVKKFAEAHLKPGLLKKETLDLWTSAQKTTDGKSTNYGIGWRTGEDNKGRRFYGHSGGSVGGTSWMLLYPEQEVVVVLLSNMSGVSYKNAPFKIGNQFLSVLEKK